MLPNRMNEVVRSIISGGVAALVAVAATITTLSVTTLATSTAAFDAGSSGLSVIGWSF